MAKDPIVFACANPVPEIWPWEAKEAGAMIVATGRSDFPNQVNNSLGFPGIFRGVLDVRARTITDEMAIAAASELARCAEERGIDENSILSRMDEWEMQSTGGRGDGHVRPEARHHLEIGGYGGAPGAGDERDRSGPGQTHVLMKEGLIPQAPG